ncbi:hypothetical protein D3C78_1156740 [compost metagenome]
MGQLRKEDLQHGLGGQFGDASRAAGEAGFDEIGFPREQWAAQGADDPAVQAAQVAVQIDQEVAAGHLQAIMHRGALAQHAAGYYLGAGLLCECGRVIDGAVIHDDHLGRCRVAERIGDHIGDVPCLVQGGYHYRCIGFGWRWRFLPREKADTRELAGADELARLADETLNLPGYPMAHVFHQGAPVGSPRVQDLCGWCCGEAAPIRIDGMPEFAGHQSEGCIAPRRARLAAWPPAPRYPQAWPCR